MANVDLIELGYATTRAYERLGNEVFEAAGAIFVRNRDYPRRHDANYVGDVTASDGPAIAALLERVEVEFAGYRHRRFNVGPYTPPPFAAHLALDEWNVSNQVHLVLEGEVIAPPRKADIRAIATPADWEAYSHLRDLDWEETSGKRDETGLIAEFTAAVRSKVPHAQHWLAWAGSAPVAYGSSWAGTNGIGLVEDLFTHPAYRHRGLATALITHAVADARRRGTGAIMIGAFVDDTPKHMYAAMGFRPLFVSRSYTRYVSP